MQASTEMGEEWKKKVYTDECTIVLGRGGKPKKVRRPKGTDIGYLDKYLQPTFESGRFSVFF